MAETQATQTATPWGTAAAILGACVATLAGVARGLEPDVILWRASVTAILIGALATATIAVTRWLLQAPSNVDRTRDAMTRNGS